MAVRTQRILSALTTTTATSVYTCPAGFVAKIDKLTLSNTATTDNSNCIIYKGTSAATGTIIIPAVTVPASSAENPSVANHALEASDQVFVKPGAATNLNVHLTITERTQP